MFKIIIEYNIYIIIIIFIYIYRELNVLKHQNVQEWVKNKIEHNKTFFNNNHNNNNQINNNNSNKQINNKIKYNNNK